MSWDQYVATFVDGSICTDAAIFGLDNLALWAGHQSGCLVKATPQELGLLVAKERGHLFTSGFVVGGERCGVLRDNWCDSTLNSVDARTKCADGPTYNIHICKTNKCIIILKGAEGIHGSQLSKKCYDTANYLRNAGY
ncbi:profilin-1 [Hyperolius riggenbachi]|uniref:profilin-1 n=1 Tax=Hyperolius riggenbachi TaxID=752182 RepID=UPI0035A2934E